MRHQVNHRNPCGIKIIHATKGKFETVIQNGKKFTYKATSEWYKYEGLSYIWRVS